MPCIYIFELSLVFEHVLHCTASGQAQGMFLVWREKSTRNVKEKVDKSPLPVTVTLQVEKVDKSPLPVTATLKVQL